jgi:hypothetical protein
MEKVHKINDNSFDTPTTVRTLQNGFSLSTPEPERHVTALREIHVLDSAE